MYLLFFIQPRTYSAQLLHVLIVHLATTCHEDRYLEALKART